MNSSPSSTTKVLLGQHTQLLSLSNLKNKMKDLSWMISKGPFSSEMQCSGKAKEIVEVI